MKIEKPQFPTYHGELPACLNPLNPRHYFLLAYWIFFRPTALKCYLYQADPELYKTKTGAGLGIFKTVRVRAYRNLYLMTLFTIFISILIGFAFLLLTIIFSQGIPISMLGKEFIANISFLNI